MASGDEVIRLFPAALRILQRFHAGEYGATRLAAASTANTPLAARIARQALRLLEVVPGVTVEQVFLAGWEPEQQVLQIGRQPPLSADKAASHFPRLREATGVPYERMLFFDDCNWGDHCAKVARACPGVVTQRTPNGMQDADWQQGLRKYEQARLKQLTEAKAE